ncbi:helix-turn-helix domain-containing protein [Gallalistipes aquisgranensis]|uniref:helix-turn-helix domain-containing protein n=1 Tax=Gallalistipes aquisgranensis TaxID=2779358 RepID=UPI001CF8B73A|nr:helix-turn-helix transcriptional regulator [Gallalistipes aquisgranensis]MBE5032998.1 AraC family transcriptional regulator [Gallalistipes aquisgranensis]
MVKQEGLSVLNMFRNSGEKRNDYLSANFVISDANPEQLELLREPCRLNGGAFGLCLRGTCELSLNLNTYRVSPRDLIVVTPGAIVQIKEKSEDFRGFLIGFSVDFVREIDFLSMIPFYATIHDNPCLPLSDDSAFMLFDFFTFLGEKARPGHLYKKEITQHLMLALFYEISAIYQKRQPELQVRTLSHHEDICKRLVELVVKHHRNERSVGFYARELCMTPKYLSSLVKRISGKSVFDWINDAVILDAKTLLKSSSMTVQQISDQLNFPNPSFFGRYFKQHTGMTPRQYRQHIG